MGIKQTRTVLVKLASVAWIGLALHCTTATPVFAEDSFQQADAASQLPDIEARTFNVTVKKRSRSGHVYLFDRNDSEPLQEGRLLLLRDGDQPVVAVRVLRDYADKNQFAGKWLRRYRGITQLEPDQQYLAIEKLADVNAPPLTSQDKADLKELEGEALPPPPSGGPAPSPAPSVPEAAVSPAPPGAEPSPEASEPAAAANETPPSENLPPPEPNPAKSFDPELDASTTPPPKASAENLNPDSSELTAADERELSDLNSITAEELVPLDRDTYWATLGLGFFRNNGASPDSASGYLTGLDMKFAKTLKRYLYFKRKNLQDSIALEGGLGYYKLISYAVQNDAFTVFPVTVTMRYNLLLSQDLGFFGYIGLNRNIVTATSSPDPSDDGAVSTAKGQLNSFQPAFGVGALFRVGPSWYIRLDAGYDLLGMALLLRF